MPGLNFNDLDRDMLSSDLKNFDPDCTEPEPEDEWDEWEADYEI